MGNTAIIQGNLFSQSTRILPDQKHSENLIRDTCITKEGYDSSALFSECRRYRYELWRRWADGPYCMFVGLNPSTADAEKPDPTVSRCIAYAKTWGYSALCMTNIFAWRATLPKDMRAAADPIGPENNETLARLAKDAGIVIAAWGKHGAYLDRETTIRSLLPKLHCLHLNADGSPKHPLYIRGDAKPFPLQVIS